MVMHYIDNLLAWGDNLFRQYTIEDIIEATMLYVLAYDLLGKYPTNLGPCELPLPETLKQIADHYSGDLGHIPEFLINVESSIVVTPAIVVRDTPHNYIPGDYFGLPENDQFSAYWDTVKQRLYNIRHGLNIDGVRQQLALFQPPINAALLVEAVDNGESVGQALLAGHVAIPYYRFSVVIAKAQAITQTVTQMGQALLAALEKKDAAQLTLLYNTHQQKLFTLTRTSKQSQLEAATQSVSALQASLQNANDRLQHYAQLINTSWLPGETAQIDLEYTAIGLRTASDAILGLAAGGYSLPTIFGFSDGGLHPGAAIETGAKVAHTLADLSSMAANVSGIVSGYQRRAEDWQLQQTLAQDDVNQINYQIAAAQYQAQVAQEEINQLELQITQEQSVADFLKNKFTDQQMYQWMIGKLSSLYFQAYQLAYDYAQQAEQAWQFERGSQQTFVHTNYWNNLYHGLLAGESLQLDLQTLDKAYMDQNERRFEIEKIISLAQLDPKALTDLKTKGNCSFDIDQKSFDADYPGHYLRQIKTISVSFPALAGPYQNVHATLTQTSNKTLLKEDYNGVKYLLNAKGAKQPDNSVLRADVRANQQVALSQGLNDSGLFQLNFNDERYLPFEGTGAISSWRLDMPMAENPLDFDSITDVIIRMQYTALDGGAAFRKVVKDHRGNFNGSRLLSMDQQYANAWNGYITSSQPLAFAVGPQLFRPNLKDYTVTDVTLMLNLTAEGQKVTTLPTLKLTPGADKAVELVLTKDATIGLVAATKSGLNLSASTSANWTITTQTDTGKLMTAANVSNMVVVLGYTAKF